MGYSLIDLVTLKMDNTPGVTMSSMQVIIDEQYLQSMI